MSKLQIFDNTEFGTIRTLNENGKVLFCGADVARALGYSNTRDALNRHCKGVVKRDTPTNRGTQQMSFIPEGDIYRLATKSELPGAEKFESWVFDEVLPSIRTHGMYAIDELLENPDLLIEAATQLKNERKRNQLLEAEKNLLEQRIAEYEPKAQYVDTILNSSASLAITQIAADYGMTAYQLNKILYEEHIQHKINGQWILYKEHMSLGYTKSQTIYFNHSDGREDTRLHTQWTQKGRLLIHNILTNRGIVANMDRELEHQAS